MGTISVMNTPPDKNTIELIARELGTEEAFVEKDWHAVQVIAAIAALRFEKFQLVFSGGTALSKAHKLIHRFSEDIDFRLHPIGHKPGKNALSRFKHGLIAALRDTGFRIDDERIVAFNSNHYFMFYISYDRQFEHSALRPDIKVEVTLDSPNLPVVSLPVGSLVTTLADKTPEATSVTCLAYVENAADKLSAAIWRISARVRGAEDDDATLIRHVYDLALLKDAVIGNADFDRLARETIEADSHRAKDEVFAQLSIAEKGAHLIAILSDDPLYEAEFNKFVAGLSYASKDRTPSFSQALQALRELVAYVA